MKFYSLLFIAFCCFSLNAQTNFPEYFDTINGYGKQLIVNGQFDVQSTSFKNEMLNKMVFGGYIDQEMKDRSFSKHGNVNFAGILSNNDITYFHGSDSLFGKGRWDWGVKAGYYALGSVKYGKDPFGLVFYGNEGYLGDTAFFTKTNASFTRFQKVGFGLRDKVSGSYVFLNLVNVQDHFRGEITKGELFQSADASEVKLKLLGDMSYTTGKQFSKGLGASIDAAYRVKVPWIKGTQTIMEVSISNIGFASINAPMQRYQADSTYTFDGFRLNQLFGDNSPFNRDDYSVLDSLGIQHDSTYTRIIALPGYIQAGKLIDYRSDKKWQSFFGIRLFPTLKSNSAVYAGAAYKPVKSVMLVANVNYGGFTTFRGGLVASYIADKFSISLGSDDIIGMFYSGGYGKSAYLRTVWNLD